MTFGFVGLLSPVSTTPPAADNMVLVKTRDIIPLTTAQYGNGFDKMNVTDLW
jgi:hypothetical protein